MTKNGADAMRDFDLLDGGDWFGVTITGYCREGDSGAVVDRNAAIKEAHEAGIKTWVSYEPVIVAADIFHHIRCTPWVDKIKIGKLNYHPSNTNWRNFGIAIESLCKELGRDYYIKDSLRREMQEGE